MTNASSASNGANGGGSSSTGGSGAGTSSLGRISTSYAAVLAAASPPAIRTSDEALSSRSTMYPLGAQIYNDDSDLASQTLRTSLPASRSQVDIHMGIVANNKSHVPYKPALGAEEMPVVALCPEYLETTSFSETDGLLLPSVWSDKDRMATIEILADGTEVKFIGPSKGTEQDAASVRSDHPMPKQCGIFYFEIEILSRGKDGYIGLGFCKANVPLNKLPGWEADSWGYHGDDGHSFCCQGTGKPYGPQFTTGDVVGCAVNFRNGTAFYTKNGVDLGTAFRDLKGTLFPAVGLRTAGEHVRVNFGARPFVFDVEHYIRQEKFRTYAAVNSHSLFPLSAGNEDTLLAETIQGLIASYLAHDGYIESTRAFAEDTRQEKEALGKTIEIDDKGEKEALQRQRIKCAVMDGDIDRAIKYTNTFYPSVLQENTHIQFRLRCRKFIELMSMCADQLPPEEEALVLPTKSGFTNGSAGRNGPTASNGFTETDTPMYDANDEPHDIRDLLSVALECGQSLQEDYRDNSSPQVQKALSEAFSLLAYTDPRNSVVSHLLDVSARLPVADELNSAILVSLGRSSVAPLERVVQHSTVMMHELAEVGVGDSAFINVKHDFLI